MACPTCFRTLEEDPVHTVLLEPPRVGCDASCPKYRVLCERVVPEGEGVLEAAGSSRVSTETYTFRYDPDTNTWRTTYEGTDTDDKAVGLAFVPWTPEELAREFTFDRKIKMRDDSGEVVRVIFERKCPLFPTAERPWGMTRREEIRPSEYVLVPVSVYCTLLYYKNGRWCGDDEHVLFTLQGENEEEEWTEGGYDILTSRVMLVHAPDPTSADNVIYWDITAAVEDALNLPRGTLHSYHSTCSQLHVTG